MSAPKWCRNSTACLPTTIGEIGKDEQGGLRKNWLRAGTYVFASLDSGVVERALTMTVLTIDRPSPLSRGITDGHPFEHLVELSHVLGVHAHEVVQRARPIVGLSRCVCSYNSSFRSDSPIHLSGRSLGKLRAPFSSRMPHTLT